MGDKHAAGKGSKYRPIDRKKYSENYEAIFGKKKQPKNSNKKDSKK
jgi:hypothetical protein